MAYDPQFYVTMALSGLAAVVIVAAASLSGWRGWLALKRQELDTRRMAQERSSDMPSAASRIEIADLKERIRKLEAIAAGVDL
jgi:hypothetical protein